MNDAGTDILARVLAERVQGEVRTQASLAEQTTLKVGGPARVLVRAEGPTDLFAVADVCREHNVDWMIVGRGSNMLVAESGWPGIAVVLGRGFRGVQTLEEGDQGSLVQIGAAEPMPVLAVTLERMGLSGMAFAVAIPGTVGGAVRMNAGAHGTEMADVLVHATVVSMSDGTTQDLSTADLAMTYRRTALPDDVVVIAATVGLTSASVDTLAGEMAEMRQWRRDHQPINSPSCGSVFANPDGDSAGRLIDAAGLKGLRIGRAQISTKHANFITTEPGASATDVYRIIRHIQSAVADRDGIALRPEVVLMGDFDDDITTERAVR